MCVTFMLSLTFFNSLQINAHNVGTFTKRFEEKLKIRQIYIAMQMSSETKINKFIINVLWGP